MKRLEELTQKCTPPSGIRIVRAALLLALLLSLVMPIAALAQERTQVYLSPPGNAPITGQPVTVDVLAQDVSNLYGAEIHLRFDPATMRLEDADPDQDGVQLIPGSLLDPSKGFVVANQADNQAGTAVFAITLINPAPPVEGSGVVAQATLVPLQPGALRLDLENAKLVTHDLQTLDVALNGLEVPVGGQALASSSPTGTDGAIAGASPGLGVSIWVLVLVALAVVSIPLVGAWFIISREAKGQS
jgi:hypothetical protein